MSSTVYLAPSGALAAAILQDIPAHQTSLQYFNIDLMQLNKPAYAQVCRKRVKHYLTLTAEKSQFMARAEIAHEITHDPKAHFAELKAHDIDMRTLYREAKRYERKQLFNTLNADEKQLSRSENRYRRLNQLIGKGFHQRGQHEDRYSPGYLKLNEKLQSLMANRDALAHRMMNTQENIAYDNLFGETNSAASIQPGRGINPEKMQKQAEQYRGRVEQINYWQSLQEEASAVLKDVTKQLTPITRQSPLIAEWLGLQEELRDVTRTIQRQLPLYRAALQEKRLSEKSFTNTVNVSQQLKKHFESLD